MYVGWAGKLGEFWKAFFLPTQSLPRLVLRLCCKMGNDFSARSVIGMSKVSDLTFFFSWPSYSFNTNIWGCGGFKYAPQSIPKFLFLISQFLDVYYPVQELLTSASPSTNPVDFKSLCIWEPLFQAQLTSIQSLEIRINNLCKFSTILRDSSGTGVLSFEEAWCSENPCDQEKNGSDQPFQLNWFLDTGPG